MMSWGDWPRRREADRAPASRRQQRQACSARASRSCAGFSTGGSGRSRDGAHRKTRRADPRAHPAKLTSRFTSAFREAQRYGRSALDLSSPQMAQHVARAVRHRGRTTTSASDIQAADPIGDALALLEGDVAEAGRGTRNPQHDTRQPRHRRRDQEEGPPAEHTTTGAIRLRGRSPTARGVPAKHARDWDERGRHRVDRDEAETLLRRRRSSSRTASRELEPREDLANPPPRS